MTDPFFQQNSQAQPQMTPEQQLQAIQAQQLTMQKIQLEQQMQTLLQQEQVLRQQLQQMNQVRQNPQLTPEQRQQVQYQGQQLNMQLTNILTQREALSGKIKSVIKPQIKKWAKVSMKGFLLGCGIFLVAVLGIAGLVFYNLVQDPDKITSMGLTMDTAKKLLQAFVSIFFGLLVFGSFSLLVVNVYRLFTVKNKKKVWYGIGTFLGLLMLIGGVAWRISAIGKIWTISPDANTNTQNVVISYLNLKDGPKMIDDQTQIIGPAMMVFALNGQVFNTQVLMPLGPIDTAQLGIKLDCGNGQTLPLNLNNLQFEGSCLYKDKWGYQQVLQVDYVNAQTQEKLKTQVNAGIINLVSSLKIITSASVADNASWEINVGKIPSKVTFDATEVFADLGLTNYVITRDVDDDGVIDREDDTEFSFIYKKAQVYNVNFRIPALNDLAYTFPIRVEPSDVPICEIKATELKWMDYSMEVSFIDNNEIITDYAFSILDLNNGGKQIDTLSIKNNLLSYSFPWKGVYAVAVTFLTDEGKKWSCESQNIEVGSSDFGITYSLKYKAPSNPQFTTPATSGTVSFANNILFLNEIPTIVQVQIDSISPQTATLQKKVLVNGEQKLSIDEKTYEINIEDSEEHIVQIIAEDTNRGMKSEETFTIKIKRDDIVGKLLIKPDTVGTDPFEVQFDASTTVVNDPTDEIVYFSWDFGDGEIKKDVSQAIIAHTYRYNYDEDNGTYKPSVTLRTKKGREVILTSENDIIVKKEIKTFAINIDSHPTQQARVWDMISLSLSLDTLPQKIVWDFGDGNTLECKERECVETTKIYNTPGEYKISVQIIDEKAPMTDAMVTLKVME